MAGRRDHIATDIFGPLAEPFDERGRIVDITPGVPFFPSKVSIHSSRVGNVQSLTRSVDEPPNLFPPWRVVPEHNSC